MKAMWAGFAAAAVIALGAGLMLPYSGFSAAERHSSANVRLN